jgi:hypothetical protein
MATTMQSHPSALDPVPRHRPRYRWRTWLRDFLPMPLAIRVRLGARDCGQHEWRHWDASTDVCWHCIVGERPRQPIDVPIDDESRVWLAQRAEEGDPLYAAIVERFHEEDRELGRSRWYPPADAPRATARRRERLFAPVSSMVDAARRSARRLRSP